MFASAKSLRTLACQRSAFNTRRRQLSAYGKAVLIEDLEQSVFPHILRGAVKPVMYKTFDLGDARRAHALMDSGTHIGKIVLTTQAARSAP
jgi:NADPH:quinone reductase-like Zn-dependent oxidoreductase